MRRPQRLQRGPADQASQDHLTALHMDVYGYVTDATAQQIESMSWLRCAQETATLTRRKADKDALARARAELRQLHADLFGLTANKRGGNDEKLADIDTYPMHRVQSELATLRRMQAGRDQARRWRAEKLAAARRLVPGPDGSDAA